MSSPTADRKPNRLLDEKSPYLQQHAWNPVDWYPWGDAAFERARAEDRPIFLSIGYSTCHWCHVMERESFEDPAIAALMNELFVNIKVDREERPDVDRMYMATVQALTGSGGWPLSVWLTPELLPFYAGTYYPPESRYGRPGFPDILRQLHAAWMEKREQVVDSGQRIVEALRAQSDGIEEAAALPGRDALDRAFRQQRSTWDRRLGGFGQAPKFPRPSVFGFLLRHHAAEGDHDALEMTLDSLRKMWAGGIYDHLGGGFHRYSVDAYWRVPHFEKMLYDQAQLATSFLEAYLVSSDLFFAEVALDVLDYVARDLRSPEGGLYSAEDADSAPDPSRPDDKEEGAFYLWERAEVEALLGAPATEAVTLYYGISERGNTISDPQGELGTRNVLYRPMPLEPVAEQCGLTPDAARRLLDAARARLAEELLVRFADPAAGALFDHPVDASVLVRSKELYDGAEPSGNAMAALGLLRLSWFLDRPEWRQRAAEIVRAAGPFLERAPHAVPQMLQALDFLLAEPTQVVIGGDLDAADTRRLLETVRSRFMPHRVVLHADGGEGQARLQRRLPFLEGIRAPAGGAVAHVCHDYRCELPVSTPEALAEALDRGAG